MSASAPAAAASAAVRRRVLVSGATGFVGQALVARLEARGHTVGVLERVATERVVDSKKGSSSSSSSSSKKEDGGERQRIQWDAVGKVDRAALASFAPEAVVHLSGATIAGVWTASKKAECWSSRIGSTAALGAALRAAKVKPEVVVAAAGISAYDEGFGATSQRGPDARAFVETDWSVTAASHGGGGRTRKKAEGEKAADAGSDTASSSEDGTAAHEADDGASGDDEGPDPDSSAPWLTQLSWAWERAHQRHLNVSPSTRVLSARFGLVMHPSGGLLGSMLPAFKFGVGGVMGDGQHWMSWVSRADTVRALEFAICHHDRIDGDAFNVTSPNAARNEEFTRALGSALHRPTCFWVPQGVLRSIGAAVAGDFIDEALLSSVRVAPRALLRAGFQFRDPQLNPLLEQQLGGGDCSEDTPYDDALLDEDAADKADDPSSSSDDDDDDDDDDATSATSAASDSRR